MRHPNTDLSGFDALRVEILRHVIRDYNAALKHGNEHSQRRLEAWFRSPWGQLISGDQGDEIIKTCQSPESYTVKSESVNSKTKGCIGCVYHDTTTATCDYMFITGHLRPCPGGKGCTVRSAAKKRRRKNRIYSPWCIVAEKKGEENNE